MAAFTNKLIHESSPYLLQHAHNPVNWYPWGEEALQKARNEDKMLLISIGYSSCHWCHVMEHESFESEEVAQVMNDLFVCIKVDREERPDIDQIYMDAVQLVTRSGGWPLNCFALPDGKPFYGGTYFKKADWINLLKKVASEYANNRKQTVEFAEKLTQGVVESGQVELNDQDPFFHAEVLDVAIHHWTKDFDHQDGGFDYAPKFPMPNNFQFLLRYGHLANHPEVLKHVKLTLNKMALGGIYDQLGGGFSRYATDMKWLVPHFEKMLYDNAQLLSLYAEAYQKFGSELYRQTILDTIRFCEDELSDGNGIFYSALDADSEGEEGLFYTWTEEELKSVLGADFDFAARYFNVNENGHWEHGRYIFMRSAPDEDLAKEWEISLNDLLSQKQRVMDKLRIVRNNRIRPGLDDKSLTSWNALMVKGLCDSYLALGEESIKELALKTGEFVRKTQRKEDGGLWHSYKKGESKIEGYLEDYAFVIEAFIGLYSITFDESWLREAEKLTDYTIQHFLNADNGLFYFTSNMSEQLVSRKTEINDNVIPASNSAMAKNLYELGHYLERGDYLNMAQTMLNNVQNGIARYPAGFSNWSMVMMYFTYPFNEVVFTGEQATSNRQEFEKSYHPNKIIAGSVTKHSELPLLKDRVVDGKSFIYVCRNHACQLPVTEVAEAQKQLG